MLPAESQEKFRGGLAMKNSLDGKLVVAISSRALFDFEQENQVYERQSDIAYMKYQLDRIDLSFPRNFVFQVNG